MLDDLWLSFFIQRLFTGLAESVHRKPRRYPQYVELEDFAGPTILWFFVDSGVSVCYTNTQC